MLSGLARRSLLAAVCIGFVACGGGGGASPEPSEALVRSSGELGPAGGTLGTQGVLLEVPAGALADTTNLSISSFTPEAGELARFRFAPAGLQFLRPATLRVPVANFPAGAQLYWQVGGDTVLLPATLEGNTLVTRIGVLGFTASGGVLKNAPEVLARRAVALNRAQDTGPAHSGDLVVKLANCQRDVAGLQTRLRNAAQVNNLRLAVTIFNELKALQTSCTVSVEQLEAAACTGLSATVAQASASRASTFSDVQGRTASLLGATANVQLASATCPGNVEEQAYALLPTVFNQFLDSLQAGVRDGSLFEDAGPREFTALFSHEADCQLLFGVDPVCDRFSDQIYPDLLDAIRRASFDECRQTNSTLVMSQFHAMGELIDNETKFYDHGRFSLTDVRRDISYCTNPRVELRVFEDALDLPNEILERRQSLQLAPALGDYRPLATTQVPRNGSLNLSGVFRGQRCATGEALPADLVVRLSTIELARRALVNGNYDFSAQPFELVISRTGLSSEVDNFTVSFQLEGGRCELPTERDEPALVVMDRTETLFEVEVVLPSLDRPVVLTDALPAAVQNRAYQAALASNLPLGTGIWQLSSGNLPPGLTLDSNSGSISGTPSATGSFTFTVQVSAGAQSGQRALSIEVSPEITRSVQFASGQVRIQDFQRGVDATCTMGLRIERLGQSISIDKQGALSGCSSPVPRESETSLFGASQIFLQPDGSFNRVTPNGSVVGTTFLAYRGRLVGEVLSLEASFYRGTFDVVDRVFSMSTFNGSVGASPP